MKLKYNAITIAFIGLLALSACAQSKKTTAVKNGDSYAKVLQGNMVRTLPGAPGMEPVIEYRVLVVWKSKQAPETFFWRGEGDWLPCSVAKAKKKKTSGTEFAYSTEEITLSNIKPTDTLELLPVTGGKYPIPAAIPETAINTIFFKTTKSAWLSLPVKNIKRKNIVMP